MGIYVRYQKVGESDTWVEYRYGKSADALDKWVMIDKSDHAKSSYTTGEDRLAPKVIGRAWLEREQIGKWPEGGEIMS